MANNVTRIFLREIQETQKHRAMDNSDNNNNMARIHTMLGIEK
jgi:hypothetical protein